MTEEQEERVCGLLEQGPVTPDEVAASLGVAWATAQGLLLKLLGEGKVAATRKGRVNVYFMKEARRITPSIPNWTRVRSLEELSRELEPYFSSRTTAAEMVRRERRTA